MRRPKPQFLPLGALIAIMEALAFRLAGAIDDNDSDAFRADYELAYQWAQAELERRKR